MGFDRRKIEEEVDRNCDVFEKMLPMLMETDAGRVALMRHQKVDSIHEDLLCALRAGHKKFSDGLFSVQEITDEPLDLGVLSHVLGFRPL
ncbi:MAG: hypothetical protein AB7P23_03550 [Amphiplicatus sp.]